MRLATSVFLQLIFAAGVSHAQTVVPNTTIQPGEIVEASNLTVREGQVAGTFADPSKAEGFEARKVLYAGQPIRQKDLRQPSVIQRNQLVQLVFSTGGMSIITEGRALDRASAGDVLRVMNLASRTTVSGKADAAGTVFVSQ